MRIKPRAEYILPWVQGPDVLDIGCVSDRVRPGSRWWLHGRLREAFPQLVGIDSNDAELDRLKNAGFANLHSQDAHTFDLPQRFDTIVAGEIIEHLDNLGMFLRNARRHLRDDGRLIVTTPNPFGLIHLVYAFLKYPKTCGSPDHVLWLCPTTMENLVQRHGLRISHWNLIEDYETENRFRGYSAFVRLMTTFRALVPKLLRCNDILFVLSPDRLGG